ncbi:hypothetical protein J7U22_06580 [Streptococcus thermophilus]
MTYLKGDTMTSQKKKQVKLKEKIETTSACPKPRPSWSIGRFYAKPTKSVDKQQTTESDQSI